jgi:hypothetical protein
MTTESRLLNPNEPNYLSLFCSRGADGWRVDTIARWLPRYLREYFDRGQAYPVQLDLDELERQMKACSLDYERRVSTLGDVELTAQGQAGVVLSEWLASMFATGVRPHGGVAREKVR